MNIVEKNYAALKANYPDIYNLIVSLPAESVYTLTAPKVMNGGNNLLDRSTGRLFYPDPDPMAGAVADIRGRDIKTANVNIFLGAGLMYQVFAFFNNYTVRGGFNMIIEKEPEIFRAAMHSIDLSEMLAHTNFVFMVGAEIKNVFTKFNSLLQTSDAKFYVKAMNFIEQPVCFSEGKDYYMGVLHSIRDAVREVLLFYGNDPNDSMIGIDNTFANIEEIIENPGIQDLKDRFKGKPGIVVSTGPSLNKNIHLLKGLENKAVICAPDASLRVMRRHGFKPHMVTSLERLIPTSKLFENLEDDDFKDVYFAGAPVVHPQTYANFKGKRIIVYRNFATFKWLDIEKGILNIGPSAGNMAFKILEYMGCDPIILIGQDLSFGDDGNTHAAGSTNGEKEVNPIYNEENVREVEGNYRPKVRTNKVWEMFLNYYHRDASQSPSTVINATEGGAKIYGTHIMTFQEAIDRYIHDDIDTLDVIEKTLNVPTEEQMADQRRMVLDKVVKGLETCENAIKVFDECYTLCDTYFDEIWEPYKNGAEYDMERAKEISDTLDERTRIFSDPDFFNVLMHYVQSYFIRCMIEVNSIKNSGEKAEDQHFKIVDQLKDMNAVMIHLVRRMMLLLERLRSKLEQDIQA